jgi:hypothetical protein
MIVHGADKIFMLLARKESKRFDGQAPYLWWSECSVLQRLWLPETQNLHHSMDCGKEALGHLYCEVLVLQESFNGTAFMVIVTEKRVKIQPVCCAVRDRNLDGTGAP